MRKPFFAYKRLYLFFISFLVLCAFAPHMFDAFLMVKEPFFQSPIIFKGSIPIRADDYGNGYFGARRSGGRRTHKGIDIKADVGTSVLAAKSGLACTGCVKTGMGNFVKIKHKHGYSTVYGHLSKILARDNTWVWQGEIIGRVGKTGNANYRNMQPHLHFEIRYKDGHVDPLPYILRQK